MQSDKHLNKLQELQNGDGPHNELKSQRHNKEPEIKCKEGSLASPSNFDEINLKENVVEVSKMESEMIISKVQNQGLNSCNQSLSNELGQETNKMFTLDHEEKSPTVNTKNDDHVRFIPGQKWQNVYKCGFSTCEMSYPSKILLKEHIENFHAKAVNSSILLPRSENKYGLTETEVNTSQPPVKKMKKLVDEISQEDFSSHISELDENHNIHRCEFCDRLYENEWSLQYHIKKIHLKTVQHDVPEENNQCQNNNHFDSYSESALVIDMKDNEVSTYTWSLIFPLDSRVSLTLQK